MADSLAGFYTIFNFMNIFSFLAIWFNFLWWECKHTVIIGYEALSWGHILKLLLKPIYINENAFNSVVMI